MKNARILVRSDCEACSGMGSIAASHQALRIPCKPCNGNGFHEKHVTFPELAGLLADHLGMKGGETHGRQAKQRDISR